MDIEAIARVCHETNRAYCLTIGEMTQEPWGLAPGWQRDSAIEGVRQVMADPEITAELLHAHWRFHEETTGWRRGRIKDPIAKTHPGMVPYDQLPLKQTIKDRLFIAIVRALEES